MKLAATASIVEKERGIVFVEGKVILWRPLVVSGLAVVNRGVKGTEEVLGRVGEE